MTRHRTTKTEDLVLKPNSKLLTNSVPLLYNLIINYIYLITCNVPTFILSNLEGENHRLNSRLKNKVGE